MESRSISLKALVGQSQGGQQIIRQPNAIPLFPAQAVVSDGTAGCSQLPSGSFLPIHFQGAVRNSSGELVGFYSGLESELMLWNLSLEDAEVTLSAFDTMGEAVTQAEILSLVAPSAVAVNLQQFLHLAVGSSGAVSFNCPAGLRLIGQVASYDTEVTSVA